ncbi:YedE family putative selenium metabolism protein [Symbiobacterium terraclitae]|uniref:YedE family putative selenium metabolism protein n=1 Tax=Symbiobacterium terraclitae TaxID=557451 RepID=A0ABS4JS74_9FIRM|nr:YedE family putative selenium metabolism protein [Symbiobacterium terraclitae]
MSLKGLFEGRWGIIITGLVVGILAPILVKLGNPGNMGVCVACFTRDIAGGLGLHRAAAVQYIRPEIIGLVLGATIAALAAGEWRARGGSSPLVRYIMGVIAAIGALVFLGCPWRAFLRLGGGDWNAIVGLIGFAAGIWAATFFLRRGYSLGRSRPMAPVMGWIMPAVMVGLLALLLAAPLFGRDADGNPVGPVFFSTSGPGAQHAAWWISLLAALAIGFLAQRSRFCSVGAFRNLFMLRDTKLFMGVVALAAAAFVTNLVLGQFKPGFAGQPIAHTDGLWNFMGMLLSGLAFTLGGGCPGRQLFLAGEGDTDAAVFFFGLLTGAAMAHNFNLASSAAGPSPYGPAAVIIGLVVVVILGLTLRDVAEGEEKSRSAA